MLPIGNGAEEWKKKKYEKKTMKKKKQRTQGK